ncbi:hypothetical protein CBR_g34037 [Chara braunii]|uniref:Protein kinase domain-containing protein n=1 Tax=Chara braunii TaxID=69332 RepID=A0A388LHQ6_CHABU|nr:hypothetical protein CBR_g34037 [Chara braunii]|eukprot:GBG81854.1 hypothetical protein CBR_g34037 [Chara braunii]
MWPYGKPNGTIIREPADFGGAHVTGMGLSKDGMHLVLSVTNGDPKVMRGNGTISGHQNRSRFTSLSLADGSRSSSDPLSTLVQAWALESNKRFLYYLQSDSVLINVTVNDVGLPNGPLNQVSRSGIETVIDPDEEFQSGSLLPDGSCLYSVTSDNRLFGTELGDGYFVHSTVADSYIPFLGKEMDVVATPYINHVNLIQLTGYCQEGNQCILVYPSFRGGCLHERLFPHTANQRELAEDSPPPLTLHERMSIAFQIARGLQYLHDDAKPPIIHRDIKSSNVLLGDDCGDKLYVVLADFGLAAIGERVLDTGHDHVVITSHNGGTFGYMRLRVYSARERLVTVYLMAIAAATMVCGCYLVLLCTACRGSAHRTGLRSFASKHSWHAGDRLLQESTCVAPAAPQENRQVDYSAYVNVYITRVKLHTPRANETAGKCCQSVITDLVVGSGELYYIVHQYCESDHGTLEDRALSIRRLNLTQVQDANGPSPQEDDSLISHMWPYGKPNGTIIREPADFGDAHVTGMGLSKDRMHLILSVTNGHPKVMRRNGAISGDKNRSRFTSLSLADGSRSSSGPLSKLVKAWALESNKSFPYYLRSDSVLINITVNDVGLPNGPLNRVPPQLGIQPVETAIDPDEEFQSGSLLPDGSCLYSVSSNNRLFGRELGDGYFVPSTVADPYVPFFGKEMDVVATPQGCRVFTADRKTVAVFMLVRSTERTCGWMSAMSSLPPYFDQAEVTGLALGDHSDSLSLFCILVYPYFRGGCLHERLFPHTANQRELAEDSPPPLTLQERMSIAFQIARGLQYLHDDAKPPIIHWDIKSSNVLLGDGCGDKIYVVVADFGLAAIGERVLDTGHDHVVITSHIGGTFGYMSQESMLRGELSEKNDVYSFGVLVLELLTGRKVVTRAPSGVGWQTLMAGDSTTPMVMSAFRVAWECVHEDYGSRPAMRAIAEPFHNMLLDVGWDFLIRTMDMEHLLAMSEAEDTICKNDDAESQEHHEVLLE